MLQLLGSKCLIILERRDHFAYRRFPATGTQIQNIEVESSNVGLLDPRSRVVAYSCL
jgi:hypothetical protein